MARIAGVDLPNEKRIEAALPYIFGVGPTLANKIARAVEKYKVEGDLRREIQGNIKRLQEIGSYRGIRHSKNLPVRGQRTRVNARTKRGKRITIGTVRKEIVERTGKTIAVKPTKEGTAS